MSKTKATRFLQTGSLMALLCLLQQVVLGQGTVKGIIQDKNGTALHGASVILKREKSDFAQTLLTDSSGLFHFLEVAPGKEYSLTVSYVGYKSQVSTGYTVKDKELLSISINLQPLDKQMDEFVVVGYGTKRKADLTGSVAILSEADFNKGVNTSAQDLITGKIPGVVITSDGGAPGANSTIRIRGGASITASNDPLIVIDGVPIDNDPLSGMANPLSTINPDDIESFTVLKDASATAIFGSRASNGVILITTKKGGGKLSIGYTGNMTVGTLPKRYDVFTGDGFRALVKDKVPAYVNLLGSANTDWQKEVYRTAIGTDHAISIKGSAKALPYRLSLGYTNQNGILTTSNNERVTAAITLNPSFFDNYLKVNINLKGIHNNTRFANTSAIASAISMDPTQPVKNNGAFQDGYFAWLNGTGLNTLGIANPVALLELTNDRASVYRSIGNISTDYKVHFLPKLHLTVNLAYDYSNSKGNSFTPENTSWTTSFQGAKRRYTQTKNMELADVYFKYASDINTIKSNIDVTAGYSYQHFRNETSDQTTNAKETTLLNDLPSKTQNYLVSFFGRLNYTYNDKYLATFTLRSDGSSRFAPGNRWGLFPSAALAWKIKEESFLKSSRVISDLKLRIGYGLTGQQDIGEDYPYLARYTVSSPDLTAQYQLGNTFYNTLRPSGYDKDIKWETTETYNAGLDFSLYEDALTGSFDAYMRKTRDLLNTIPVPAGTNLSNYITTNIGNMENRGLELSLNYKVISNRNLTWKIGYNISYNKNKITKLTQTDDPTYAGVAVGTYQINSVGYSVNSFYLYEQKYDDKGQPVSGSYVDRNNDGIINNSDFHHVHQSDPSVTMGLSSFINAGNWSFAFSGRANLGNHLYNYMKQANANFNIYNQGYLKNVLTSSTLNDIYYLSDYYVENASFFRMDHINIGYRFPHFINKNTSLEINAAVQNVFIITKYSDLDPEVFSGVDENKYPRPRTFLLGMNIKF